MSHFVKTVQVLTLLIVLSQAQVLSRNKRWLWDNILNMGGSTSEIRDVSCGLHPIKPNMTYRIQTTFHSMNLPYPAGEECTWKFHGESCTPVISCDSFALAQSVNCTGPHLEITDKISGSEYFCGSNGPQNVSTGSYIMEAVFPRMFTPMTTRGFSCLVKCLESTADIPLHIVPNALPPPETRNCSCGVPGAPANVQGHRVVGGKDAVPLYWKWQVGLLPKTRKSPFCGASLINDRFVLTAAHCVVTTGLFSFPPAADVLLNAYDLKNTSETITLRRGIVSITPHPFYDPVGQDYDFAIIEFSEPVDLTASAEPKVTPICLPPRQTRDSYAGTTGTVTGWGTTSEGGTPATVLQEAEIPIITNQVCNDNYRKNAGGPDRITPRMLCASYPDGGIDSCQGDSGGPFMISKDSKYYEVGVVSFGEGCARRGKPGVYSRVTEVNDWIRQVALRGIWCQD